MAISGSNLDLSFVQEPTWGVTPATPQMKQIRGVTSESLGASRENIDSTELNKNRAVSDSVPGQMKIEGDINFEAGVHGVIALIARQLGSVVTTEVGSKFKHVITVASKPLPITIEKFFADASEGFVFKGMIANNSSFSVSPDGLVTGTIGFMGGDYVKTSAKLDTTPTEQTHEVFDGIRSQILANDVEEDFQAFSLSLTNNLKDYRAIGKYKPVSLTAGIFDVSGSFTMTYEGGSELLANAIANIGFPISCTWTNGDNSIEILLPNAKVTGNPVPTVANADQLNLSLNFKALQDKDPESPTYAKSIQITLINDEPTL